MRLFTAIDPPADVRRSFADLQRPGSLDARWSEPEQFHVTLRFLGDVTADDAKRYKDALDQIEAHSVECIPYGLDVLPSRRNPRVLMVGLERSDDLVDLYGTVSNALEAEGLEPETRTYRPHVTLARLNDVDPRSVHAFLDDIGTSTLESFTATEFHLYKSTLTPDGAEHERQASFPLA